jgi:hypothetical protein
LQEFEKSILAISSTKAVLEYVNPTPGDDVADEEKLFVDVTLKQGIQTARQIKQTQ